MSVTNAQLGISTANLVRDDDPDGVFVVRFLWKRTSDVGQRSAAEELIERLDGVSTVEITDERAVVHFAGGRVVTRTVFTALIDQLRIIGRLPDDDSMPIYTHVTTQQWEATKLAT